jgi:hypothetical protein
VVTPDVQDSMMDAMKTQVSAQVRRTVNDSVMTTTKSQISTAMRWTMCGTTKNVVCRYG